MFSFRVTGLVQGVNFRSATADRARELSLRGWVRNAPDDTVEGAAGGDQKSLDAFRSYLNKGPSAAKVDNVDIQEGSEADGNGLPHPFEVRK
ncbi:unnamed protein product [Jaminaea pallidilutea]